MTRVVLTYEDFAALADDGKRYEPHEGALSVTPAPGTRHQLIIGNLYPIWPSLVFSTALRGRS